MAAGLELELENISYPARDIKGITMPKVPNGNQVANLGLPGVLGAAIIGLLLLPPRPVNTVPVVNIDLGSQNPSAPPKDPAINGPGRELLKPAFPNPRCTVTEYTLADPPYIASWDKNFSRDLQLFLEKQRETLQECIAAENVNSGSDKSEIEFDRRELASLEKSRDNAYSLVATLQDSNNLLVPIAQSRLALIDAHIMAVRNAISTRELNSRNREYETAELTRYSGWIDERLKDPERLRPEHSIGDYLKGLSDNIGAFIALAASFGALFKVIVNPIGSQATYKALFKEAL